MIVFEFRNIRVVKIQKGSVYYYEIEMMEKNSLGESSWVSKDTIEPLNDKSSIKDRLLFVMLDRGIK